MVSIAGRHRVPVKHLHHQIHSLFHACFVVCLKNEECRFHYPGVFPLVFAQNTEIWGDCQRCQPGSGTVSFSTRYKSFLFADTYSKALHQRYYLIPLNVT